jgi:hypothetical protein
MENNQKGIATLLILGLVAAIIIAGLSFAYVKYIKPGKNENKNTNQVAVNANLNANTNQNSNLNINANLNANANAEVNANANTNTAVDTSGWKTYDNTTYGYVVKYPASWKLGDSNPANVFFKNGTYGGTYEGGDTGIRIEFYNSPDDMSTLKGPVDGAHYDTLAQWVQANKNYVPELFIANSSFLGLSGYEAAWPAMAGEYKFFLEKGSKIMVVSLIYLNSPERNKNSIGRPEFTVEEQSFFNTFQFTDETAGWKTYTNTEYSYTFKYPTTWFEINQEDRPSNYECFASDKNTDRWAISTGDIFLITAAVDDRGYSLLQLANEMSLNPSGTTNSGQVATTIAGQPAYSQWENVSGNTRQGEWQYVSYVKKGSTLYVLDFISNGRTTLENNLTTLKNIIFTTQFTK